MKSLGFDFPDSLKCSLQAGFCLEFLNLFDLYFLLKSVGYFYLFFIFR